MRILNKKNKQKKMLFSHVILCFLISLISLNGYSQTECSSFKKLEKAISKNDQKAINKLINGGININSCRDKEGNTCLMFAVSENNIEMTRFLIEKGAAVNRKNIKSQSTLILAVLTRIIHREAWKRVCKVLS
jgi:ankyrin repeat protein